MNLYYNIICLVTILGLQLNVQAPKPSRKKDVKSDEGAVSIKVLKEELSDVSPAFQSFRTNAKQLTDNLMKSFNELSVILPDKKDIPDYIRNLLFIVKLDRYIKEKEKHGKTGILIDNVVDSLIFFPKLYETFTKIKNERIPKKKGKVPSREETVRWRKSANVSRKSSESSELDETLEKKHRKKEKPGHAPNRNDFSESEENGRRKLNKKRKSKRSTSTSDDDLPEETASKKSSRKGKRAHAKKESSESSEPEVPRKNSEKKRHKQKSSSDKMSKKEHRESVAADFPSDLNVSGDKSEPAAPPSPVSPPSKSRHTSEKQSTSHEKSSTAADSQEKYCTQCRWSVSDNRPKKLLQHSLSSRKLHNSSEITHFPS